MLAAALLVALAAMQSPLALPSGAVVIEEARIPETIRPHRSIMLWMIGPKKFDRGALGPDNPYNCPDTTLGSYYTGPTRLSLLDTRTRRVINTIPLRESHLGRDWFRVPYRMIAGRYYSVPDQADATEGIPKLLHLRDFNGDGLALEAAFYEAFACMGLATTLFGYSPSQDRLRQYPVDLTVTRLDHKQRRKVERKRAVWADYLYAEPPVKPGEWDYRIDYRGRGGPLANYKVRYDALRELFRGTLNFVTLPEDLKAPKQP